MIIQENMSLQRKLEILSDAAKYDVACTSSGVDRQGGSSGMGNSVGCGICHSFSADGRCISLLKILFTNECIFDCAYCINRSSNDVVRASFTPQEVSELTMEFYRRNYIEGLFLSSGVLVNPNYTMELICETLRLLREEHHFNGYIHCKAIPGADPALVERLGFLADRMSVNLELPTAEGLKQLAPHKNRKNILKPMRQIQLSKEAYKNGVPKAIGQKSRKNESKILLPEDYNGSVSKPLGTSSEQESFYEMKERFQIELPQSSILAGQDMVSEADMMELKSEERKGKKIILPAFEYDQKKRFVPAGQSTQMIIGASGESDYQIMSVSETLYRNFDLKRVFYSAFIRVNEDKKLPVLQGGPPLLREHRLYQADWLLRFYGFQTNELLSEQKQNFNILLDPKCDWAVNNLGQFPIEVQKASYYTLLRVPGIGVKSARRIIDVRKHSMLDFTTLKKIGVVLKRAAYFITCNGKMMMPTKIEENYIVNKLLQGSEKLPNGVAKDMTYRQLSLFDDWNQFGGGVSLGG